MAKTNKKQSNKQQQKPTIRKECFLIQPLEMGKELGHGLKMLPNNSVYTSKELVIDSNEKLCLKKL